MFKKTLNFIKKLKKIILNEIIINYIHTTAYDIHLLNKSSNWRGRRGQSFSMDFHMPSHRRTNARPILTFGPNTSKWFKVFVY